MDQARMDRAMNRIEAALRRIEQASARAPAPPRVGSEGGWNAHRELKKRVRAVLGELDQLIASVER